ncbi:amino acid adenylation domain-containing protein [Chitinophaga dinghuensis]|uniref:Amino acid adenylation domain-containing protein n=1 Tax=Chitinophaga dinghuensis TaxID=1539050 RepID=A0A327VYH1_9BACT|nr:non-ribosomal peptide synthetase [Chitinophaga dinghuensis]RAJ76802.1 amino acid adenylation domain-containing protein [Chitinophaga dinghuensis]
MMKLTLPQQDIYYEQLLFPDLPVNNIGARICIKGDIQLSVLNAALTVMINHSDACRSVVVETSEGPLMRVLPEQEHQVTFQDFSQETDAAAQAENFMQTAFAAPFDLSGTKWLFRFSLVKVSEQSYYLLAVYHHLITDGWGSSLMFGQLVENYNHLLESGTQPIQVPHTYQAFVKEDEAYQGNGVYQKDLAYWQERFSALPPAAFPRLSTAMTVDNGRQAFDIPAEKYQELKVLAQELNCSVFHIMLAALYTYIHRRYQQQDISFGLPVLNRSNASFKKTIGLFSGISPLRMYVAPDDSFRTLTEKVRAQLRKDYRHQRFPLGKLVKELGIFHERERLFSLTVSYEKQDFSSQFLHTHTKVQPHPHGADRTALAIAIREHADGGDVTVHFDYNGAYFNTASIALLISHFQEILHGVMENSDAPVGSYSYLSSSEKSDLQKFNDTTADYDRNTSFLSHFQEQVKYFPEKAAVKDEYNSYTYTELEKISGNIARHITAIAGDNVAPVAVMLPRSAKMVAVLLGVLRSGRAYIPVDPDFPEARMQYILENSQPAIVIATAAMAGYNTLHPDDLLQPAPAVQLPTVTAATSAYIIYTSGSTGNPKGVEIGHGALLNLLLSIIARPGIGAEDVFFSVTTPSFDISVLEFFGPLTVGATLYVADRQLLYQPEKMIAQLNIVDPDILQGTPGFYQILFDAGWKGNRKLKLICGGDLLSQSLVSQLLEKCGEVWNLYGPTETTIYSTCKQLTSPTDADVIGAPINNTRIYILHPDFSLTGKGTPGAIYIGGEGLAKGYFNNPELTRRRFISDPYMPGEIVYETGDLGYWTEEGEIKFLGRNDFQVKIRGYRIELGEIETLILKKSFIRNAVVIARKQQGQEAFLVAYIIADQTIDTGELIEALKDELPEYMVPRVIRQADTFPLTPNNKVDRGLMATWEVAPLHASSTRKAATTSLQYELCRMYKEILALKHMPGINEDFFALGGHSINAMRLVNQVHQLGYLISMREVFHHPTVEGMAQYLEKQVAVQPVNVIPRALQEKEFPLTPGQQGIWLSAQQHPAGAAPYNVFAVYEVEGELQPARLQQVFTRLIAQYEILRTNFREINGAPCQLVKEAADVSFKIDHLTVTAKWEEELEAYVNHPFDLENDLLLRVALMEVGNRQFLAFSGHHIILDGWSIAVLINKLDDLYQDTDTVSEEDFQFRDYVPWLEQQSALQQPGFWEQYLDGYHWEPLLPPDYYAGGGEMSAVEYTFSWDMATLLELKQTARELNSTLHILMLSAFLTLVHKLTGKEDICIGTLNSGRTSHTLLHQPGMFVKTLPLRLQDFTGDVATLLDHVHAMTLDLDAHQDIPEAVAADIQLDCLFVVQPPTFDYDEISIGTEATLKYQHVRSLHSRLPLLVNCMETATGLQGIVTANADWYDKDSIALLFLRYQKLLQTIITSPQQNIAAMDISLAFENEQVPDIDFNF